VIIVIAVFVLTFLGVAWGLKTRQGSGINEHPGTEDHGAVPDSEADRSEPELFGEPERPEDNLLDQHGKK
jgi:hypothetical protein